MKANEKKMITGCFYSSIFSFLCVLFFRFTSNDPSEYNLILSFIGLSCISTGLLYIDSNK